MPFAPLSPNIARQKGHRGARARKHEGSTTVVRTVFLQCIEVEWCTSEKNSRAPRKAQEGSKKNTFRAIVCTVLRSTFASQPKHRHSTELCSTCAPHGMCVPSVQEDLAGTG